MLVEFPRAMIPFWSKLAANDKTKVNLDQLGGGKLVVVPVGVGLRLRLGLVVLVLVLVVPLELERFGGKICHC